MVNFETYRSSRDIEFSANKAAISGLPEQIGLTQEQVFSAFLSVPSFDEAKSFVITYLAHVRENIDLEHEVDSVALTRRHLVDQMYHAHTVGELKLNHPANIKARRAKTYITEAMIEVLGTEGEGMNYGYPPDREYAKLRDQILERKRITHTA